MRGRGERGAAALGTLARVAGLAVLVIATVVVSYLALTRDTEPPGATDAPSETEPSAADASDDPDAIPEVEDQLRADFATSPELPAGARTYDNPAAGSPLAVTDGLLTHAAPVDRLAIGSLEVKLTAPVQKLGGVISFPIGNAGSAFMVGWADSLVDARTAGKPVPPSGLRLEVDYGLWQLSVYDKTELVIGGDEYEPAEGALQKFEVYRSGDRAWVVDPSGKVTIVTNPAIETLTGPFAGWQVVEDSTREKPVGFQSIWAG